MVNATISERGREAWSATRSGVCETTDVRPAQNGVGLTSIEARDAKALWNPTAGNIGSITIQAAKETADDHGVWQKAQSPSGSGKKMKTPIRSCGRALRAPASKGLRA